MSARTSSGFTAMLLAASLGMSACMPQVLHGPHVEPGATGAVHLDAGSAVEVGRNSSSEYDGLIIPSLYVGARHGWVSASGTTAASFGLQVPVLGVAFMNGEDGVAMLGEGSYADLYVQVNRQEGAAASYGGGILASTATAMPYVQYGQTRASGDSWYTTQAVVLNRRTDDVWWMPSVTWRDDGGNGRAMNYTAGAGFDVNGGARSWVLVLGMTVELGLDRPH